MLVYVYGNCSLEVGKHGPKSESVCVVFVYKHGYSMKGRPMCVCSFRNYSLKNRQLECSLLNMKRIPKSPERVMLCGYLC